MKRSSSTSDRGALFSAIFSRGGVSGQVNDGAWLEAMLDVEAALARALARAGLAPADAATAITEAVRVFDLDVEALGVASSRTGNPVLALVEALSLAVSADAASTVHRGATSQDILDTGMMLVAKRASSILLDDIAAGADASAALAERHRGTVMAGRTLLQQATPITFGLKAAGWLSGLDLASARLHETRERLPVQLGGAAGTLAPLGDHGVEVAERLAQDLGLAMPVMPWHTQRLAVFEFAGAAAGVATILGKIARDVTLLAQSEVGEVAEGGEGGRGMSSTMPNKRNPVAAVAILACTRRIPGLLATVAAAGEQEHERAAGSWHSEWETFSDLLRLVGSAAAWSRELLEGLTVDPARMKVNIDAAGATTSTEHLVTLLAPTLGRLPALDLIRRAVRHAQRTGRPLIDALFEHPATADALAGAKMDRDGAARALDPRRSLGSTHMWIDRALAAHGARAGLDGAPR